MFIHVIDINRYVRQLIANKQTMAQLCDGSRGVGRGWGRVGRVQGGLVGRMPKRRELSYRFRVDEP